MVVWFFVFVCVFVCVSSMLSLSLSLSLSSTVESRFTTQEPTQIIAATCGLFNGVIQSDHVPHVSDQFIAHMGNTDLAILLNRDTFEPNPTSKDTWSMVVLAVRGPQSQCCGQEDVIPALPCSAGYMRTCSSTMSTSLEVTST